MSGFRFKPPLRSIEWPPGSGRVAEYSPHELGVMRGLHEQHAAGELSRELFQRQVAFIHDLKVDLDATMLL